MPFSRVSHIVTALPLLWKKLSALLHVHRSWRHNSLVRNAERFLFPGAP